MVVRDTFLHLKKKKNNEQMGEIVSFASTGGTSYRFSLSLSQTTPLSSPPITSTDDPALRYRGQSLALRSSLRNWMRCFTALDFNPLNKNKRQDG